MQAQDLLLFQAALGLSEPWRVVSVEFDPEAKRLDLRVDFAKGSTFCCPEFAYDGFHHRRSQAGQAISRIGRYPPPTWRSRGFPRQFIVM
jgi:hypothetical protein